MPKGEASPQGHCGQASLRRAIEHRARRPAEAATQEIAMRLRNFSPPIRSGAADLCGAGTGVIFFGPSVRFALSEVCPFYRTVGL